MFALLFAVLKQGPYESDGPELVGVGWGSLIMSPLLIFMMMPVAMPEAVEAGWFKPIRLETCGRWRFFLPFLVLTMLALGARAASLFGRAGGHRLLPLSTVDCSLRDGSDSLHKNADLVPGVLHGRIGAAGPALGCLGYAVEHNLAPTIGMMRPHKNPCIRTLKRAARAIGMYLCPCFDGPSLAEAARPIPTGPHPHSAIRIRSPARPSDGDSLPVVAGDGESNRLSKRTLSPTSENVELRRCAHVHRPPDEFLRVALEEDELVAPRPSHDLRRHARVPRLHQDRFYSPDVALRPLAKRGRRPSH